METMKLKTGLLALLLSCTAIIQAQYRWEDPLKQAFFTVNGQGWPNELKESYTRLPQRAQQLVRKSVWNLSLQSAGLSVAFRSNAPEIKIRYVVTGPLSMPHMPTTGVSGVDLYATDANGRSRWCGGKYSFNDTITYTYRELTYAEGAGQDYAYQLFLPLYNQITWMEIGVPTSASFHFIPASIDKPLVIYGTSIAQGACASRPGMAWGNIIGRMLEHPVVNLGFSGNGRLESELFDLLAEVDAKLYIIDCMPNLSGKEASTAIFDRTLAGVKKLRAQSPTPILLVEHSGYTHEFSSKNVEDSYRLANVELRKAYETLTKEGISNLYYLTKEEINLSMDAMVEGVHPSDLGMQQYAESYAKKIRNILGETTGGPTSCVPCRQQRDPYDWNERHCQVIEMNRKSAPDILMIGNSITHYWGGEPVASAQNGKKAWNHLFKGKNVRNLGFGWDRTENVLWRIFHGELDGYQAKDIFLLIGTNNLSSNTDEEVVQGICEVAKGIRLRQPKAKLHVLAILPRNNMEVRIKRVNSELQKQLNGTEDTYIDLTPQLTNPNGTVDLSLFSDGLHPNERGYERIAKALSPIVNRK